MVGPLVRLVYVIRITYTGAGHCAATCERCTRLQDLGPAGDLAGHLRPPASS